MPLKVCNAMYTRVVSVIINEHLGWQHTALSYLYTWETWTLYNTTMYVIRMLFLHRCLSISK